MASAHLVDVCLRMERIAFDEATAAVLGNFSADGAFAAAGNTHYHNGGYCMWSSSHKNLVPKTALSLPDGVQDRQDCFRV
jgi:hypothetical protein